MQEFLRFRIDGVVQLVPFIIDLNHRFVHRDVIWFDVAAGLYIGFLYPIMNRCATAFDTQYIG